MGSERAAEAGDADVALRWFLPSSSVSPTQLARVGKKLAERSPEHQAGRSGCWKQQSVPGASGRSVCGGGAGGGRDNDRGSPAVVAVRNHRGLDYEAQGLGAPAWSRLSLKLPLEIGKLNN